MIKMSKFKVDINWFERHGGNLIIEAENEKEAIELLKSDQNRLLEIMIDKYANDTFDYVGEIIVNRCSDKMDDSSIDVVIKNGEINKE